MAVDDDQIDWYERLRRAGITVEDEPAVAEWAEESGKDFQACILAGPRPGGHVFSIGLHPGLSYATRNDICREAMVRFDRIANAGPEPDGWQLRSDGDYQLWLRPHYFGDIAEM